jgi:hypothetical protein
MAFLLAFMSSANFVLLQLRRNSLQVGLQQLNASLAADFVLARRVRIARENGWIASVALRKV